MTDTVYADPAKKCPKCQGTAPLVVPLKKAREELAVYGCKTCGHTFKNDSRAFVDTPQKLRETFRAATMGNQTLMETMKGEKINPATKALLTAQIVEYGMQMYFDGLKQGLLLSAVQETYHDDGEAGRRHRQSEEGAVRGGGATYAGSADPNDGARENSV